ncbi:MAG: glutamyl-tRNA reductase, partial [Pseudomonadota bacterium]
RHRGGTTAERVLQEAKRRLRHQNPEAVLDWFAHQLLNQMLHPGTTQLRKALYTQDQQALAMLKTVLELECE